MKKKTLKIGDKNYRSQTSGEQADKFRPKFLSRSKKSI